MIYLDNAATTKTNQGVADSFVKVNQILYFNPNSPHRAEVQTGQLLLKAKSETNRILDSNDQFDITFTSGATESDDILLRDIAYMKKETTNEIIMSVLEHPSVLEVMRYLEGGESFKLKYVSVTKEGKLDIGHLKSLMINKVGLVTCMYVNNIMGQVQPIEEIANIVESYPHAHFHADVVRALDKVPIQINHIDSLSLSGHKFNELKGQGLLFLKNVQNMEPIVHGGGQEYGLQSGTINPPMATSMVRAMKNAVDQTKEPNLRLSNCKNKLLSFLAEYKSVFINSPQNASPRIIGIGFSGIKGEVFVNAFSKQNVTVSTISACSSKINKSNRVLLVMEITKSKIEGSMGISLETHATENDVLSLMNTFESAYKEIKELLK